MTIRIESGFPRGGLGYCGLLTTVASIIVPCVGVSWSIVGTATLLAALSVWLGLGLKIDGAANELSDEVVFEDSGDSFFDEDDRWEVNISTLIFAGAAIGLILCLAGAAKLLEWWS